MSPIGSQGPSRLETDAVAVADLWSYSLSRYRRNGVPPLCLTLQDCHGADVNLVLFALWLGEQRFTIRDDEAARQIRAAVSDWHRDAVVPLRSVRRWLKNRDFPDPNARDALRAAIQRSEIEAERLEQSILQRLFDAAWRDLLVEVEDGKQAAMARNARWFCQTDAQGKAPDPIVRDLVGLCL